MEKKIVQNPIALLVLAVSDLSSLIKHIITVLILIMMISLFGCGASIPVEENIAEKKPITLTEDLGMFKFEKAVNEVPIGEEIGGYYTGWAAIKSTSFVSNGEVEDEIFIDVVSTELKNAGYKTKVINKELFVKDTSAAFARFLIGAVINGLVENHYESVSRNDWEVSIDIRWEIYDSQENMKIYSKKEKGLSVEGADVFSKAYRNSVRMSIRNFLSNPDLISTIKEHITKYPEKKNNKL